jgi:Xaa-Pro dipeptidase
MERAQQAAVHALRSGVPASAADPAARAVIDEAEYGEHVVLRSGHRIGIGAHELPHLRFDSHVPPAAGMVVTIEPGFYVPGLGGFRHSDPFVVTDEGSARVTGE